MKTYLKINNIPILLISFICLCSCSSDEDPVVEDANDTYLDYRVTYNADADETTVSALLRTNSPVGNDVMLQTGESLTFSNDALEFDNEIRGYTRRYNGRVTNGSFVFTSVENITYTSPLSPSSTVNFESTFMSVSKGQDLTITWDGDVLLEGEFVEVFIGNVEDGVLATGSADVAGDGNVTIAQTTLASLPTGTWPAQIQRITHDDFENATRAGARIVTKYQAPTRQIEVVE